MTDILPLSCATIEQLVSDALRPRGIRFVRLPARETPERELREPIPTPELRALSADDRAEALGRLLSRFSERLAASGLRRLHPLRIESSHGSDELVCAGSWPLEERV